MTSAFEPGGDAYYAVLNRRPRGWKGSYPDLLDKPNTYGNPAEPNLLSKLLDRLSTNGNPGKRNPYFDIRCPRYVTVGECEEGHIFARELVCCREWCKHCGQEDGIAHRRRKVRWYPRGVQIDSMGYVVITLPIEIRYRYRTQKALSALGVAFRRMMQRHGFKRGLRGWDWFGEPENAPPGQNPIYHPHISFLVEGGWLDSEKLDAIKRSVKRILGIRLDRVNVYYRYSSEVAMKLHWLKYVTRPTFLDWRWDPAMAMELRGFRVYQSWGKWKDKPVWDIPENPDEITVPPPRALQALERGFCPECGGVLTWGSARSGQLVEGLNWHVIGAGYYRYRDP